MSLVRITSKDLVLEKDEEFKQRLVYLFRLLVERQATSAQKEELFLLLAEKGKEQVVNELLGAYWEEIASDAGLFGVGKSEHLLHRILAATQAVDNPTPQPVSLRYYRFIYPAAAACVFLILMAGAYLMTVGRAVQETPEAVTFEDISPGGEKAMLTLANGTQIPLDEVPVGVVSEQGDLTIRKQGEGVLEYDLANQKKATAGRTVEYHTISTPAGGKYKVVLPDGSRVWLNAATTLRYPARFDGQQRNVELKGEAYLEINTIGDETGKKVPFRVMSGDQLVEVLGTHFNINSYEDEKIAKTTLLEGSIRVRSMAGGRELKLVPGERSELSADGELKLFKDADLEESVAWRDDFFSFNGSDVYSIMRQIARWYDVEVQFEPGLPREHLTGYITRKVPLSSVVSMLEQTSDLRFRLEGRTVTVAYQ